MDGWKFACHAASRLTFYIRSFWNKIILFLIIKIVINNVKKKSFSSFFHLTTFREMEDGDWLAGGW